MKTLPILIFILLSSVVFAQPETESDSAYYANYNQRIMQSRINGVYIPADMEDAFSELKTLSDPAGLEKFKNGPEEIVAQKLKGGLGRWMLINWSFHEGSRFSHYLKEQGILHPEDMAQCMIVSFHRYLNGKPIELEAQAEVYQAYRKAEYDRIHQRDTFRVEGER